MEPCKTSLPNLEFLEVMVINACNLACSGCTTFSDLKHSGYIPWKQGRSWLEPWIQRVNIQAIGVMGGEPLINPELRIWLSGIRELLPDTQIRFVTNGLLLPKNPWVLDLLEELGNSVLKISKHVDDAVLTDSINHIFSSRNWRPIHEYGIDRWVCDSGLRFQVATPKTFLKTFRNEYSNAAPHCSNPGEAFSICVQKKCPLLINGKIWKCGTAALTPLMLERFNWPNHIQWEPFITPGLEPTCTDEELLSFVDNFGKPHLICKQCPTSRDVSSLIDHYSTVDFK